MDYSKFEKLTISDDEDETNIFVDLIKKEKAKVLDLYDKSVDIYERLVIIKLEVAKFETILCELYKRPYIDGNAQLKIEKHCSKIEKLEKEIKAKVSALSFELVVTSGVILYDMPLKSASHYEVFAMLSDEYNQKVQYFAKNNAKLCQEYSSLSSLTETGRFFHAHPQIVCSEATSYMLTWIFKVRATKDVAKTRRAIFQFLVLEYLLTMSEETPVVNPKRLVDQCLSDIYNAIKFLQKVEEFNKTLTFFEGFMISDHDYFYIEVACHSSLITQFLKVPPTEASKTHFLNDMKLRRFFSDKPLFSHVGMKSNSTDNGSWKNADENEENVVEEETIVNDANVVKEEN
ncbi:hsp90 co-chaperone Cdc37-like, partial [Teleopsis dalmanni]|uniref:hsp90 co-chaperone Cdc37-like n=1 Tax=Teleopsis dalmanni TaxID=139649 RepID=UPI0018CCAC3B